MLSIITDETGYCCLSKKKDCSVSGNCTCSNFEIGEVGLPHFIDLRCGMLKLVSCLHENIGRTGDQL